MIEKTLNLRQVRFKLLGCLLILFLTLCCGQSQMTDDQQKIISPATGPITIEHAIGFDIVYHDQWKELQLFRHYNDFADTVSLALVNDKNDAPQSYRAHEVIQIPVKKLGALSTTHLSMFDHLSALDQLKAVETKKYIYNEEIFNRVEDGQILELAPTGKLNVETTVASGIEVLMGVGFPNSQNEDYQTLQRTGLPVILNADWQEKTLLGRAEWIKLLGVLLNKEQKANQVFSEIEQSFNEVLSLLEVQETNRPMVITGLAEGDSWYVAGGNSFAHHILELAKVNYPWSDTESTGSVRLDFESVYQKGLQADYWLVPSTAKTLAEITMADSRYSDFKSFQQQQIYNIYARYKPGGGNDYYESAIMAPHLVLKDVIKIFHPELLPLHELVYYNRLQ